MMLGIGRTTIYRKLKSYGADRAGADQTQPPAERLNRARGHGR